MTLIGVCISLYYSNIRIFQPIFGGQIHWRIQLAEFFSADKNSAANSWLIVLGM